VFLQEHRRKPKVLSRKPAISPARTAAFDVLLRVEREDSYASELLHASTYKDLSTRDHALATELVMGALRWRPQLDEEIAAFSSQSLARLDPEILVALRLALYQFRHLDRVPRHAALNDSVELVKRARKRSAAPFVNAVLRKLSTATAMPTPPPADSAEPLSPEIPARAFAHPLWLVERWTREFGLAAAQKICEYDQTVPQTVIRLRSSLPTPTVEAELGKEGIRLTPGDFLATAQRVESGDVTRTQAFQDGRVVIQDEGSQLVAALAGQDIAGTKILDCCAAPGGKTLAMADRNPQTVIIAAELHPHRARLMQKLMRSAPGAASIRIVAADAQFLPTSFRFDRVLADVPCSGTGTLARNPEIKWRLRPEDLLDLQSRQCAILESALAQVAPGGRVIYSTCSLEREENEAVIEKVSSKTSFRVIDCRGELERLRAASELVWNDLESLTRGPYLRTIPGIHPCDGFFAAVLEKLR
jgi:16S rRNA (cytosine967-C5)-methyltransferase